MDAFRAPYALVVLSALAVAACGGAEDAPMDRMGEEAPEAAAEAEPQAASMERPDTLADEVWAYLQAQDYRETWDLWPGKGELYEGTEPHGMRLTTYANEVAMEALRAGDGGAIADGGMVVKENYMPDSTLAAVTVMYRVQGYDAEHSDWWFLKRLADGTVEASGRVDSCQACHAAAPGGDYLYTPLPGEGG